MLQESKVKLVRLSNGKMGGGRRRTGRVCAEGILWQDGRLCVLEEGVELDGAFQGGSGC